MQREIFCLYACVLFQSRQCSLENCFSKRDREIRGEIKLRRHFSTGQITWFPLHQTQLNVDERFKFIQNLRIYKKKHLLTYRFFKLYLLFFSHFLKWSFHCCGHFFFSIFNSMNISRWLRYNWVSLFETVTTTQYISPDK